VPTASRIARFPFLRRHQDESAIYRTSGRRSSARFAKHG
jgi:hypothetical protein